MSLNYDVVVIGAGYIGCAVAYHLTNAGLRTALLDRGGVAAGASRANYGNVQVQDSELRYSLPLTLTGFAHCEQLEEELGQSVGYRRLGGLLVIETEAQWQTVEARLPVLHEAGIQAELIPARHLVEVEPLINSGILLGGCYHQTEAQVYPFALLWAYLRRAGERGLALFLNTELLELDLRGGRIRGLRTTAGEIQTPVVVLCTGAWTRNLGRQLGRSWEISHVHGQALVTEAGPQQLNCHISSAAFFEDIQDDDQGVGAVLAVAQSMHGHFLLGEAGVVTSDTGSMVTPQGQAAIAVLAQRYFPWMHNLRILRGWAAPVAFTDDNLPFLGPVSGIEGLILATAFKSTVIVAPLVGETVAQLVTSGQTTLDLTPFSPDRTVSHGP